MVGTVGVDDGDTFVLDADCVRPMLIRDDDVLCARVPCERDVIEDDVVLRDNGVAYFAVRAREKKYGADPAEEEQYADEEQIVFLHGSSLP